MVIKAISERRAKNKKEGWYKGPPIAALRRAKFHLPRQAAAPQYTSRGTRDIKSKNSKIYIAAMAAVHKPQYMRKKKYLVYCGSCTAAAIYLKVASPQYMTYFFLPRVLRRLVFCRSQSRHWCAVVWVLLYGPPKRGNIFFEEICNCRKWNVIYLLCVLWFIVV